MSLRHTWVLSVACTALLLLGSLPASGAITLQPARFDESVRVFTSEPFSGFNGTDILAPEQVPVDYTSPLGTHFTGSANTYSFAALQVEVNQTGGDGNIVGGAGVIYHVAFEGPSSASPIPVLVKATGFVKIGNNGTALGSLTVRAGTAPPLIFASIEAKPNGLNNDSFLVSGVFQFEANTDYTVSMNGNASAVDSGSLPGAARVFLDPQFTIDPGFAGAGLYTISYSPGIVPVPEPSSVALLGIGAVVLAVVLRRKRHPK